MSTSRLFIALYPDDTSLGDLLRLNQKIVLFPSLRITSSQQRHLTLCFLGEINDTRIPAIRQTLAQLSLKKVNTTVVFDVLEYGANPVHPNLIWLRGQNPSWVLNLWQEIKKELATILPITDLDEQGQKSLTSLNFLSHLTLARFKNFTSQKLPTLSPISPLVVNFQSLALIKSMLTLEGPVYNILDNISLKVLKS